MKHLIVILVAIFALSLFFAPQILARGCPPDSVQVGSLCVDKYEASVWQTTDSKTILKIKKGRIRSAKALGSVATQRGATSDDYGPGCPDTGNGCKDFYAVSVPGVTPSSFITWFQAAAACRNAGKRLLTNAEWQVAALGTPDTGGSDDGTTTCNTDDLEPGLVVTGSRGACVSDVGAYDMVGNVWEWVADWMHGATSPFTPSTGTTGSDFGDDFMNGPNPAGWQGPGQNFPGALIRGGTFNLDDEAGVFALNADVAPSSFFYGVGFRCGR